MMRSKAKRRSRDERPLTILLLQSGRAVRQIDGVFRKHRQRNDVEGALVRRSEDDETRSAVNMGA